MDTTLLSLSHFIHLMATVVWIGGIGVFVLWIYPESKKSLPNPDERRKLLFVLQRRFRPVANFSLVMLLGTGMLQMSADPNYEGILQFTNTWSIAMVFKHLAYVGMVGIMVLIQFGLAPSLERAHLLASKGNSEELDRLLNQEALYTKIIGILGVIVLACTAIATAV
jgi:uncharacterized membrane protein